MKIWRSRNLTNVFIVAGAYKKWDRFKNFRPIYPEWRLFRIVHYPPDYSYMTSFEIFLQKVFLVNLLFIDTIKELTHIFVQLHGINNFVEWLTHLLSMDAYWNLKSSQTKTNAYKGNIMQMFSSHVQKGLPIIRYIYSFMFLLIIKIITLYLNGCLAPSCMQFSSLEKIIYFIKRKTSKLYLKRNNGRRNSSNIQVKWIQKVIWYDKLQLKIK